MPTAAANIYDNSYQQQLIPRDLVRRHFVWLVGACTASAGIRDRGVTDSGI
jgi:hypothetical protein